MNESIGKKSFWDKLDIGARIAIPLIIAFIGWYLAHTYQAGQQELYKAQIEAEILRTVIRGNEFERKKAIEFALAIAKRFNDPEFAKIVSTTALTEDTSEEVKVKARKTLLKISLHDPNSAVRDEAQKTLQKLSLEEKLKLADNFFKVGHFSEASQEYEEATHYIPFRAKVDLAYLEEARRNMDSNFVNDIHK